MKSRIYYTKPSITEKEIAYATDAATHGWGDQCYDYIYKFEDHFKKFAGTKFAIATSSCTGALHLGMYALGIKPSDEVILADTNWVASVAPIVHLGAKPIFVDVLPDTWCLDPDKVEQAITPKTKAILAVHIYGNLCEMDKLLEISKKHNIPLIEDSAEAVGSYWQGQHAGTMGAFGSFSFHGTKTVTTGEGGMLITNDKILYDRVLTLNNHGRRADQTKQFWADEIGFKYKISNLQAAIGCAQIERVDELVRRKREIFNFYKEHLIHDHIQMNPEKTGTTNGYWMPTAVFSPQSGVTRDKLVAKFKSENIDARIFFWPLSSLPMFTPQLKNKNSFDIPGRAINLPSYHDITQADLERVCKVVLSFLSHENSLYQEQLS